MQDIFLETEMTDAYLRAAGVGNMSHKSLR